MVNDMTVCGNKLSSICGASCTFFNICRNNEIAKLPKSNIEWMREASLKELAEVFGSMLFEAWKDGLAEEMHDKRFYENLADFWLKQPHRERSRK